MQAFTVNELIDQHGQAGKLYLEFLRVPALSAGLYILPPDSFDPQLPHTEDEIYYIASGHASLLVEKENQEVTAGSLVFVPANVEHRFHSISETLTVLVFFAPAEYSQARQIEGTQE